MDFFGDYSIEVASCHPSSLSNYEDNVSASSSDPFAASGLLSPRDTRTSYPVEFANMSNLAREFGLQSLDASAPPASSNEDYTLSSTHQYNQPPSPTRRSPPGSPRALPCWRRRAQRQRDLHLQSDPSHLRSIRELVERMVSDGDQCETTRRTRPKNINTTPAVPLAENDDEEDSECSDLSSPRSYSDSSNDSNCAGYSASPPSPQYLTSAVSKNGRIQKTRSRRSAGRDRR